MSNQSFIFNSSTGGASPAAIFNVNKPTLIRAAGLTETVDIYMMVGDCPSCRPEDILWTPMTSNGKIAQLSATNNYEVILIPGRYSIGNPMSAPLVLVGDVNITKEDGVDTSALGKSSGGGAGSTVTVAPTTLCIYDATGVYLETVVADYGQSPPVFWTAGTKTARVLAAGETISLCSESIKTVCTETAHGTIISAATSLALITGVAKVSSLAIKGLGGNYDISFDGGVTYNLDLDGSASWGEGNGANLNTALIFIRPNLALGRVQVTWETQLCINQSLPVLVPVSTAVTGVPVETLMCVGGAQLVRRDIDGVVSWLLPSGATATPLAADLLTAQAGACLAPPPVIAAPTTGAAVIGALVAVAAGSVVAGKQSVSFTNTGTANATVQGANMKPGESRSWEAYLDPVTNVYRRLPAIAYSASATAILSIGWTD